ncbi:MAG: metallophosphoesterase family protein [Verrucomicrobiota bacterium]
MRCFAIGDVHGCANALRLLDEKLGFNSADTVVMLGDYVDRGPDSRGVIEHILDLRTRCHLITLRGNHEVMMLAAREDPAALQNWLTYGGDAALESYHARSPSDIPENHWEFLRSTVRYHEEANDFFVHAGADPTLPFSDQPDDILYWKCFENPLPHISGKRLVCGHTSQKSGNIDDRGHSVCIDTFAHGGGWLTCLDVNANQFWQASEGGDLRDGGLPPRSLNP